ncbi:hypothetical protein IPM65_01675 [Candidatus Roizmanbacteria bacterium]|nr:MAG: hypothetical protein IPM65_01675 [Candidatus Roizmanbacteria bacterium]
MYKKVIQLYKPVGKTPLDMIRLLRRHYPQWRDTALGYAGRLDPMAEGLLLILADDENNKRKTYERLEKEYEFEVLFGITTDTYDPLGIVQSFEEIPSNIEEAFRKYAPAIIGKHVQPYPPYSSARVNGKPLFYWARLNKLQDIRIPEKIIEISDFQIKNIKYLQLKDIYNRIMERIDLVHGDFRQEEITKTWNKAYAEYAEKQCMIAACRIVCSSGTYVRSLAHLIGKNLGTGALALSIKRTRIGNFELGDALKLT